jgi:hypothetical protein
MTAGASALLVLIGGGTAGIAVATEDEPVVTTVAPVAGPAAAAVLPPAPGATAPQPPAAAPAAGAEADTLRPDRRTSDAADRTGTRPPRTPATRAPRALVPVVPAKPPAAVPVITTRTVVEKRAIAYRTRLVRDPNLPRGAKRVHTPGVPGEETRRFLVTLTDGRETGRRLVAAEVTREPQHRVVAFGSRRGDNPRECRADADRCRPTGRSVACPEGLDPAIQENGSLALLEGDLTILGPDDLDGLELDAALLC